MALGSSKPVCYYQFENNANDTSNAGNSMNGTIVTGGSFSTAAKVRGSYSFLNSDTGGTGCIHSCGSTSDVSFLMTGVFTLSWWTKRSATGATEYVLGTNTSSPSYAIAVKYAGTQLGLLRYATGGAWTYSDTSYPGFADTDWHHLVITCDGSGGNINFYADGSKHGATKTAPSFPGSTANTCAMMLGSIPDGSSGVAADCTAPWGANFLGYMDEVSFWDAAATAAEVTSLYNSGGGLDLSDGLASAGLPSGINSVSGIASDDIEAIIGVDASSVKTIIGVS